MKKTISILLCSSLILAAPGLPFYRALAGVNPAPKGSAPFPRAQVIQNLNSYVKAINSIPLNPYTFPQRASDVLLKKLKSPDAADSEKLAAALIAEALADPEGAVARTGKLFEGENGSAQADELLVEALKGLSLLTNILHSQPERHESVLIALVPLREALASQDAQTLKARLDSLFSGSGAAPKTEPAPVPAGSVLTPSASVAHVKSAAQKNRRLRKKIVGSLIEKLESSHKEDVLHIWDALWPLTKEKPKEVSSSVNALIAAWSKAASDDYGFRYNFVQILAGLDPASMAAAVPALLSRLSQNPSDPKLDDILQVLAKAAGQDNGLWGPIIRPLTEQALKNLESEETASPAEKTIGFLNMAKFAETGGFTHLMMTIWMKISRAKDSELAPISRLMGMLRTWHVPPLREALWEKLKSRLHEKSETAPLGLSKKSHRWFKGQDEVLKRRMPTLFGILQSPQRLGKFLMVLSLLRLAYPYDLFHSSDKAVLAEQIAGDGIVFGLEELRIVPVSESFRRHIIYVEDQEGLFAVEIKMPGEMEKKTVIHEEHFTVAQQLWGKYPEDPGVAQPVYFGKFQGELPLYGKTIRFDDERPLGVMIFKYEDGRRFYRSEPGGFVFNAASFLKSVAGSKGISEKSLLLQALTDVAVAAIRLHRLGWRGSNPDPEIGTEMHPENWRVLSDGRGQLVGDFGVFEKASLTMEQRSKETLALLGSPSREARLEISDEAIRRLETGKESAVESYDILEEVILELVGRW